MFKEFGRNTPDCIWGQVAVAWIRKALHLRIKYLHRSRASGATHMIDGTKKFGDEKKFSTGKKPGFGGEKKFDGAPKK